MRRKRKKRKDERQSKKTQKEIQKAQKKTGESKKSSAKKSTGRKSSTSTSSDAHTAPNELGTNPSGTTEDTIAVSTQGNEFTNEPPVNGGCASSSGETDPPVTICLEPSLDTEVTNPTSSATLAAPGDQGVGIRKRIRGVQIEEAIKPKRAKGESNSLDAPCLYCSELFSLSKPGEQWVQCAGCKMWAHESCADISPDGSFVCELCSH